MRCLWPSTAVAFLLLALPGGARAGSVPGPDAPRSFYLFGPPIGVPPARPTAPVAVDRPLASNPQMPGPALSGDVCREAAQAAGKAAAVPDGLMGAIARVESGRPDGSGGVAPWPWSINVQGTDHVYDSKAEVIAAVLAFQRRGIRSIDVGCLQVNLMYHPNAFASLEEAFDPMVNATYAAKFLGELLQQTGSWERATANYHSADPELGEPYRRKVQAVLPEEKRIASIMPLIAGLQYGAGAASMRPRAGGGLAQGVGANPGSGGGGAMLSNNAVSARILPLAANAPPGRDINAYRAMPIQITGHALPELAARAPSSPRRFAPPA